MLLITSMVFLNRHTSNDDASNILVDRWLMYKEFIHQCLQVTGDLREALVRLNQPRTDQLLVVAHPLACKIRP